MLSLASRSAGLLSCAITHSVQKRPLNQFSNVGTSCVRRGLASPQPCHESRAAEKDPLPESTARDLAAPRVVVDRLLIFDRHGGTPRRPSRSIASASRPG